MYACILLKCVVSCSWYVQMWNVCLVSICWSLMPMLMFMPYVHTFMQKFILSTLYLFLQIHHFYMHKFCLYKWMLGQIPFAWNTCKNPICLHNYCADSICTIEFFECDLFMIVHIYRRDVICWCNYSNMLHM